MYLVDCPSRILDSDVSGPSAGRSHFKPSWFVYPYAQKMVTLTWLTSNVRLLASAVAVSIQVKSHVLPFFHYEQIYF